MPKLLKQRLGNLRWNGSSGGILRWAELWQSQDYVYVLRTPQSHYPKAQQNLNTGKKDLNNVFLVSTPPPRLLEKIFF